VKHWYLVTKHGVIYEKTNLKIIEVDVAANTRTSESHQDKGTTYWSMHSGQAMEICCFLDNMHSDQHVSW
jgi:hypothetical protein